MYYVACCKDEVEKVEKLSFKRLIGLMYEIACKENREIDGVVDYVAELTKREPSTTKMLLAEL